MKESFVSLFSSYISDPHLALEQGRSQVGVPHSESQVEVPHSESQELLLAKSLLEVLWLELVPM